MNNRKSKVILNSGQSLPKFIFLILLDSFLFLEIIYF